MEDVSCPHCGHEHSLGNDVPNDVVVVMPCPECQNLIVLFRHRAIGLDREILEGGSHEERRDHIAEVLVNNRNAIAEGIAELLEAGIPWRGGESGDDSGDDDAPEKGPISEKEIDKFLQVDLDRIDDAGYFRRNFE